MIGIGEAAPDFEIPGTDGSDIELYRLSEYTEDGLVVLVFYPFDFSPVGVSTRPKKWGQSSSVVCCAASTSNSASQPPQTM